MSDTTNQTKIGANVIGAAVIALIVTVAILAIVAVVAAQCCTA